VINTSRALFLAADGKYGVMTALDSGSAGAPEDPLWRARWLMLASGVSVLIALAVFVAEHHAAWSWPLFAWGLGVGLFGLAVIESAFAIAVRRPEVKPEQKARLRRRQYIYIPAWIQGGIVIGTGAAAFDAAWVDIVGGVYVVLTLMVGVIVAAFTVRRRGKSVRGR
jgi:hypothetical protein